MTKNRIAMHLLSMKSLTFFTLMHIWFVEIHHSKHSSIHTGFEPQWFLFQEDRFRKESLHFISAFRFVFGPPHCSESSKKSWSLCSSFTFATDDIVIIPRLFTLRENNMSDNLYTGI